MVHIKESVLVKDKAALKMPALLRYISAKTVDGYINILSVGLNAGLVLLRQRNNRQPNHHLPNHLHHLLSVIPKMLIKQNVVTRII